jgi:acetoin:2,6-dichlorophenolindophenol oxidoreductase subunit alpha
MNTEKNVFVRMFETLSLIRAVGEKIVEEYPRQEMKCPVHLSIGQEASAVGVCASLEKGDVIFSNHRCHAHYLAKGGNLKKMIAELYGREAGCTGGWGGSMHLTDIKAGLLGSSSIVSGSISIAVGSALAFKMQGKNNISVVFFGDGAAEEGVFYESMNFASMMKLPVIFVCENNRLAVDTELHIRQPDNIYERGSHLGVLGYRIDGQNAIQVYTVAKKAIDKCRETKRPVLLECVVERWAGHVSPNYTPTRNCPMNNLKMYLMDKGLISEAEVEEIHKANRKKIEKAFAFAKKSPIASLKWRLGK